MRHGTLIKAASHARAADRAGHNFSVSKPDNTLDIELYIPYHTTMEMKRLGQWKGSLELEADSIRKQIQSLTARLQRKTEQIDLISRLIDSANDRGPNSRDPLAEAPFDTKNSQTVLPSQVKDHVYEILGEAKRPMNIKEIHSEFIRRAYPIPGKGTSFNILVHISRELKLGKKSRFYRTGRGTYYLRGVDARDAQ